MRAIWLPTVRAIRILNSGSGVMPVGVVKGALLGVGMGNSVIWPEVVIRPILSMWNSVNQRLPSRPGVITKGTPLGLGIGNSVTWPEVVMRPIFLPSISVNQRFPSEPAAMLKGMLFAVGMGNSVK